MSEQNATFEATIWENYSYYGGQHMEEWAVCKYCKKLVGSSKEGITYLKNHLKRCQIKRINEKPVIHEDVNDLDVARMIIKHGVLSLGSIKDDILSVHLEEKKTVREALSKLSCHFSLLFNFSEDHSFCFLAIYYIDDEWEMKKKILQLSKHEHIYNSYFMETWKTKLCPVDYLIKILHDKITTDLLPQPGLSHKLVPAYDYVGKMSLNECNQNVIDKAVSLCSKVIHGWDYEFKICKISMELKEVFRQLELLDPNFKTINLSKMEWDEETAEYKCLTELKDAASSFCLSQNQTVNAYFFKVCDFYKKLLLFEESDYQVVREIASDVRKEFVDKIWSNSHLVLAMSVILDPRFLV
ncbi:hypothetical protein LWI28_016238 [Acer negundo]|uniref:hAT-like transposase RNase-H fold domain-containing protein n=1 Tax=Acer negundo TaxID=4023 RepID=A0AAD5JJW5_ACENE|nr:hypothetical protein LWI28_016238 [Acer negundo]